MKFYTKSDYKDAIRNSKKVLADRKRLGLSTRAPLDALINAEAKIFEKI